MAQDAVAWKVTCIRWPHRTDCRWIFGCVSIREARIPERFTKELHDVLRDQPYTQAAFLAGHMGQARMQRTPVQEPQAHLQAEVVPPGPPDPPQRLLPDSAMLSELVPDHLQPPLHDDARPRLPEPATPVLTEAAGTPAPAPDAPDVAMASPLPERSEANPVSGSAASDVVPDRVTRAAEPDTAEPEPRKRLRLMAVSKVGDEEFYHVDGASECDEVEVETPDSEIGSEDEGPEVSAELPIPPELIYPERRRAVPSRHGAAAS